MFLKIIIITILLLVNEYVYTEDRPEEFLTATDSQAEESRTQESSTNFIIVEEAENRPQHQKYDNYEQPSQNVERSMPYQGQTLVDKGFKDYRTVEDENNFQKIQNLNNERYNQDENKFRNIQNLNNEHFNRIYPSFSPKHNTDHTNYMENSSKDKRQQYQSNENYNYNPIIVETEPPLEPPTPTFISFVRAPSPPTTSHTYSTTVEGLSNYRTSQQNSDLNANFDKENRDTDSRNRTLVCFELLDSNQGSRCNYTDYDDYPTEQNSEDHFSNQSQEDLEQLPSYRIPTSTTRNDISDEIVLSEMKERNEGSYGQRMNYYPTKQLDEGHEAVEKHFNPHDYPARPEAPSRAFLKNFKKNPNNQNPPENKNNLAQQQRAQPKSLLHTFIYSSGSSNDSIAAAPLIQARIQSVDSDNRLYTHVYYPQPHSEVTVQIPASSEKPIKYSQPDTLQDYLQNGGKYHQNRDTQNSEAISSLHTNVVPFSMQEKSLFPANQNLYYQKENGPQNGYQYDNFGGKSVDRPKPNQQNSYPYQNIGGKSESRPFNNQQNSYPYQNNGGNSKNGPSQSSQQSSLFQENRQKGNSGVSKSSVYSPPRYVQSPESNKKQGLDKPSPWVVEVEKVVRQPYPVERVVEKYVDRPVPVERIVEKEVKVPYPVQEIVENIIPQPYPVEKIIDRPIHVPYPVRVDHFIDRPYEVKVPYAVAVPVPVHRYIDRPYPVEKIVEKKIHVPYPVEKVVEKIIEKQVPVPVERVVEKPAKSKTAEKKKAPPKLAVVDVPVDDSLPGLPPLLPEFLLFDDYNGPVPVRDQQFLWDKLEKRSARGRNFKRSPESRWNLPMEYGFKPPLIPSTPIEDHEIIVYK